MRRYVLQAIRFRLNLTQKRLAEITGYTPYQISEIERGYEPVPPALALHVEELFDAHMTEQETTPCPETKRPSRSRPLKRPTKTPRVSRRRSSTK